MSKTYFNQNYNTVNTQSIQVEKNQRILMLLAYSRVRVEWI